MSKIIQQSFLFNTRRLIYYPIILFVLDCLLLFIATELDDHLNHGNFFGPWNLWRWGVLGLPLAISGVVLGLLGANKAKGMKKIVPLVGLILCLILMCYLFLAIANTNSNVYGM